MFVSDAEKGFRLVQRDDVDGLSRFLSTRPQLIQSRNKNGSTLLHIACCNGNTDMVMMLMIRGADINVADYFNYTPLLVAIESNHSAVALMLLDRGAGVLCQTDSGWGPAHFAAAFHCHSVLPALVRCEVNLNARDENNQTPLVLALSRNCIDAAVVLIQLGADLTAGQDENNQSPVQMMRDKNLLHLLTLASESQREEWTHSHDGADLYGSPNDAGPGLNESALIQTATDTNLSVEKYEPQSSESVAAYDDTAEHSIEKKPKKKKKKDKKSKSRPLNEGEQEVEAKASKETIGERLGIDAAVRDSSKSPQTAVRTSIKSRRSSNSKEIMKEDDIEHSEFNSENTEKTFAEQRRRIRESNRVDVIQRHKQLMLSRKADTDRRHSGPADITATEKSKTAGELFSFLTEPPTVELDLTTDSCSPGIFCVSTKSTRKSKDSIGPRSQARVYEEPGRQSCLVM